MCTQGKCKCTSGDLPGKSSVAKILDSTTDDGLLWDTLTNVFTPAFILLYFAPDDIVIHLLDLNCHGAGLAIINGTEINFPQADHFGGGAAHKDLIRDIKLVTRDGLLQH